MPEEPLYPIEDEPGKPPAKSKTLYFSGIVIAVGVFLMSSPDFQTIVESLAPEYYGLTLAAIGLIVGVLRVVTGEPLELPTKEK